MRNTTVQNKIKNAAKAIKARYNAIPRKRFEVAFTVVGLALASWGVVEAMNGVQHVEKPVVVAQVSPYAKPVVESGFFLTKTTWPLYKDTVSAEQYANQSKFDRTHLGPSNKIEKQKPIVTVVEMPTYTK